MVVADEVVPLRGAEEGGAEEGGAGGEVEGWDGATLLDESRSLQNQESVQLLRAQTAGLYLLRIYLASGYFSSGMCKLLCGARFGRFWGKGTTLQMYIFDSIWSRPAGARWGWQE